MVVLVNMLAFGLSCVPLACAASPAYPLYAYPLPIPETISPSKSVDGIDFYELSMEVYSKKVYPDLGEATFVGYNGVSPGPTFWVQRGQQTVVRYHNQQIRNCSVHLHGSDTHSPWDGWADDMIAPGMYKDYYYPNDHLARSIWYHDHADGVTATNAYSGLGGIWIIYDPEEDALGLPSGNYDVPLALTDRTYDSDGQLVVPTDEGVNQFGDVIEVNSQPWPYFEVEPRKYRLRIYDMSLSRPYELYLMQPNGDWIDFQVIASDCGLFGAPVTTNNVVVAMGERYEVIVDFSQYQGQNITMMNGMGVEESGNAGGHGGYVQGSLGGNLQTTDNTNKVMQFIVGTTVSDSSNNGDVPGTLNPAIQWPESTTEVAHTFNFQVGGDARWTINGVDYNDVNNRVLARPQQGTTELWEVRYAGGPGVHPVHVHLVSFQIVSRTGGSRGVLPYEAAGLKDIVLLEPGETAQILATYGPWNGLYMFHCHNLIHEDNAMMAVFNITQLETQGYNTTDDFPDPSDPRFIAREVEDNSYDDDQISSTISYLSALHAYDTTYSASPTSANQTASGSIPTYSPTTGLYNNATATGTAPGSYVPPSTSAGTMTSSWPVLTSTVVDATTTLMTTVVVSTFTA